MLTLLPALQHPEVWHQHGLQKGACCQITVVPTRVLSCWTVVVHSVLPLVSLKEMLPPKVLLPVARLTTVAEKVRGVP